jgi:hypothetical protein
MISVSIEVATHADAVALMRVLDRFHPWTVQLAPEHWIVVARAERRERVDAAITDVSRWAAEHDRGPLSYRTREDEPLLHPADAGGPL